MSNHCQTCPSYYPFFRVKNYQQLLADKNATSVSVVFLEEIIIIRFTQNATYLERNLSEPLVISTSTTYLLTSFFSLRPGFDTEITRRPSLENIDPRVKHHWDGMRTSIACAQP